MIQAAELRLGNWVNHIVDYDGTELPDIVTTIYGDGTFLLKSYLNISVYPDTCNGIPLTPEILGKCGFVNHYTNSDGLQFFRLKNEPEGGRITFRSDGVVFIHSGLGDNDYAFEREVKYLHHLQNLIFALTGEELPIEL